VIGFLVVQAFALGGYIVKLNYDLEEAKRFPRPGTGTYQIDPGDASAVGTWPPSRLEFQMKDEIARNTISSLEERVKKLENLHTQ